MDVSKIQAVEKELGLVFKTTAPDSGEPLFTLEDRWASGSDNCCRTVRKGIHAYLAFASKAPGVHFAWNEQLAKVEPSELGRRFIACVDLYVQQLVRPNDEADPDQPWNSHIYAESASIKVFRKTFVRVADDIRKKHASLYLCNASLKREDAEALETSLHAAVALINRPYARQLNKRLYDNMFNTRCSIRASLKKVQKTYPATNVLFVTLAFNGEQKARLSAQFPSLSILANAPFPENYLKHLQHASAFASMLKKRFSGQVVGCLARLTGEASQFPQCEMVLFFISRSLEADSELKTQIVLTWADHVLKGQKDSEKFPWAPGITVSKRVDVQLADLSQEPSAVAIYIENMFTHDLACQRLRLPSRRRSWVKSIF